MYVIFLLQYVKFSLTNKFTKLEKKLNQYEYMQNSEDISLKDITASLIPL